VSVTAPLDLLPLASEQALTQYTWMCPSAIDDDGLLRLSIHSLCVEAQGQKIVVDTCFGPGPLPERMSGRCNDGSFLAALTHAGFGRDDVDFVICTHLHVDHVGWNTMLEGQRRVPTFRNARYLVSRAEFEHWNATPDDERVSRAVVEFDTSVMTLLDHGVLDLVDPDHRVNDAVRLVPTPGHSPGHVSVLIDSSGHRALITGDCAHSPVQFAEPDWFAGIDFDRELSCSTRRRLITDYADTDVLIIGTHFPRPTAGHIVSTQTGTAFRFTP
jgi:glyoxylase-like metal-dependent hydrolase (beta-lactamase superfamily II)